MTDSTSGHPTPLAPRRDGPVQTGAETALGTTSRPAPGRQRYERIDRYVVLGSLGTGGMGTVYGAYDPVLRRRVAIKVIHDTQRGDDEAQARLLREARAMARLSHPNVIPVYDAGIDHGQVFITMEQVDGQTLRRYLSRTRRWREVVDVFQAAARGLAGAHAADLVHRDFKPDNVIIARDGRVLVLDFGVVASWPASEVSREVRQLYDVPAEGEGTGLTLSGRAVGTPAYMAPEQHEAGFVDGRADQYALCVALFEGLHGTRPFAARSVVELAEQKRDEDFVEVSRGDVPRGLDAVIRRGLAYEPSDRWPSIAALSSAIDAVISVRRRRRGSAAMGVLVAGLVTGLVWPRPRPCASIEAPVLTRDASPALVQRGEQWRAQQVMACEAGGDPALAARRAWCLEEQRAELVATASHGSTVPGWLRSPAGCADASRLLAWSQSPPADPGPVLDVRRALVAARIEGADRPALDALVAAAEATGDRRLYAEAQLVVAEHDPAVGPTESFVAAAAAMRAGDAELEARAWVVALERMGTDPARSEQVRGWSSVVEALIERGGDDVGLHARWALALAACSKAPARLPDARAALLRVQRHPAYASVAPKLRHRVEAALSSSTAER
ncbi:MAG: serine/threonine protein kinase [Deltaproteobacteria bacterium]|nr:serine/threonine protein kinase [Deltaproteobacteria bacterium]